MRYGSVCSGIEAATVAWHPLGWQAAFYSEIEKFPCAVLAHHYPTVPNHGDMTRFQEWPDAALDVLVGGTPCQSFSVAGLRKGMADPRGNLALVYLAMADRYRPRWLVWENVPGVLSSSGGRDFGAFLGGLVQLGYGFAYRVLDAQYFGVAQRRRRVFVVGYLGDWRRAAAVLFERHSLQGHPAPRRQAGEGIAAALTSGAANGGPAHGARSGSAKESTLIPEVVGALCDGAHNGGGSTDRTPTPAASLPALALCLNAGGMGRQDAESETLIPTGGCFDALQFDTTQITSAANYSSPKPGDACHPLAAGAHAPAIAFTTEQTPKFSHDHALTLTKQSPTGGGQPQCVAFGWQNSSQQGASASEHHTPTLDKSKTPAVSLGMAVRRLTPRECERLQGFPDVHDFVRIDVCEDENSESVKSAAETSVRPRREPSEHVAAHVLIDCEQQVLRLHSRGKLLWTASIAESESSSLLSIPSGDFARVIARMQPMLARQTRAGVVALPPSIKPSMAPSSGNAHVRLCGQEIRALASDADKFTAVLNACLKSTIAQPGPSSRPSALTLETLCSCVAAAMTGCIQETTQGASSYTLTLEIVTPYTLLPGKAADGPRYKALGNSMAVPVMRWIGERIAEVDAITNPKEQAA